MFGAKFKARLFVSAYNPYLLTVYDVKYGVIFLTLWSNKLMIRPFFFPKLWAKYFDKKKGALRLTLICKSNFLKSVHLIVSNSKDDALFLRPPSS